VPLQQAGRRPLYGTAQHSAGTAAHFPSSATLSWHVCAQPACLLVVHHVCLPAVLAFACINLLLRMPQQ
jgi:hypothetical protein